MIEEFGIAFNALSCSCSQENVQKFLRVTDKVPYAQDITCAGPTIDLRGQQVFAYERYPLL